jgi:nitrogen fixation NifU-like protein
MFNNFQRLLMEEAKPEDLPGKQCKIVALQGVKEFPTRIKCATLVWHTMKSALDGKAEVSTE